MSKEAYNSILAGLEDALAYAKGDTRRSKTHRVRVRDVDVRRVREKLGLSQAEFAAAFAVSVATVRNWEQNRRKPEGPARVLLNVIEHHPEAVLDSLKPTKKRA
ncbi:MAG: NadS family protein [Myxococcota bacterium]